MSLLVRLARCGAASAALLAKLRLGLSLLVPALVLSASALGLGGCGGHPEFDLSQNIIEQRVIGNAGGGALTAFFPNPVVFGLNVEKEAKARNAQGPTQSVTLSSMQFQITATGTPAGGFSSFEFVNSITVYVESSRPNSSLARNPVAVLNSPVGRILSFGLSTLPTVNLLPYIEEGARFTSTATGTVPSHDVTFTGVFTVHVRAL